MTARREKRDKTTEQKRAARQKEFEELLSQLSDRELDFVLSILKGMAGHDTE